MKLFICLITFILLSIFPFPMSAQTIVEYTHYPLLTNKVMPPNILILMDNSSSVNQQAYDGDFDPHVIHDGYFDPSAMYAYINDSYFKRNAMGNWDGNFLNWLAMRRIDILRKVLVGGKAVANSRDGSGVQKLAGEEDAEPGYDFIKQYGAGAGKFYPGKAALGLTALSPVYFGLDNGFIYVSDNPDPFSHHTRRFMIRVEKDSTSEPDSFVEGNISGLLQRIGSKARFGLEIFNDDGEGGRIINPVGDELDNIIFNIENVKTTTWSPLAESFFEGIRYFMQIPPYYSHTPADYGLGDQDDPFFFQELSQDVHCVKCFIILITDGQSTHDRNIPAVPPGGTPGSLRDYDADSNETGTYADEGSDYLDDVALWAHISDLRKGEQDLENKQNITLFTISAFGSGSGSELLKDAAKNGAFIDLNGDDLPDLNNEWDSDEDGIPDNYLEANDGYLLEKKLMEAITGIFKRTGSGSGMTIASNSFQNEGLLFKTFLKPYTCQDGTENHWMGFIHALWIDAFGNVREDTDGDKALVYKRDNIIRFAFDEENQETRVKVFRDDDGDGKADHDVPDEMRSPENIRSVWEAGEKLALRSADDRTIKTYIDRDRDGRVDPGEFIDFVPENAPFLQPYLRADDEEEAADIIDYIRGKEIPGFRKRTIKLDDIDRVWKLGDIVHSTPALSRYPLENYHLIYRDVTYGEFFNRWKDRPLTVFAGANDGMIHAFKGGVYHPGDNPDTSGEKEYGWYGSGKTASSSSMGDERWAYIPYNLLPHLKWLTSREYSHVDYVDLKPKVTDARIFTDGAGNPVDSDHVKGWGTILIGGMGLGGGDISITDDFGSGAESRTFRSAYFALDVTIPDSPRLLWEFTHPALAFAASYPAIVRVEADKGVDQPEDDRWFVLFGSGPTDYQGKSSQSASLFVVDLKTGELVKIFEGTEDNSFMSSPVSIDANLDFNTDVVYVGESHFSEEGWEGKMYRLSTKVCAGDACKDPNRWSYSTDPDKWTFSTLFSSPKSITAASNASLDEHLNLWVYFGTGRNYAVSDSIDASAPHYFFGVKDPCYQGNCTDEVLFNQLYDSSEVVVYQGGGVRGAAASNWNDFVYEVQEKKGWYLTFPFGKESIITKPGLLGGSLIFTTYERDDDICSAGGRNNLYTLYYKTGTAWKEATELVKRESRYGDGGESKSGKSEQKNKLEVKTPLQKGLPAAPVIHVGETVTVMSSDSDSLIGTLNMKTAFKVKSGMESWKEE